MRKRSFKTLSKKTHVLQIQKLEKELENEVSVRKSISHINKSLEEDIEKLKTLDQKTHMERGDVESVLSIDIPSFKWALSFSADEYKLYQHNLKEKLLRYNTDMIYEYLAKEYLHPRMNKAIDEMFKECNLKPFINF